jgi:hypothetical protein
MIVILPVKELFTRDALALLGDVFSIASFVVSVSVLLSLRNLRILYRLRVRGPSLIRDLSKSASNLSNYLNEYAESIPQIQEELGRVGGKLRSLENKTRGRVRVTVRKVRRYIDQCEANPENETEVRAAYRALLNITEELKDHQKDLEWEL